VVIKKVTENQDKVKDNGISAAKFHPDGLIFATGEADGALKLWDITTQNSISTLDAFETEVSSLAFSENGFYVAATSLKNSHVKIWDLRNQALLKSIDTKDKEGLTKVEFDFSGSYIGVTGKSTHIYDSKKFTSIKTFSDHKGTVTDIKFGLNSKKIATSSMDRSINVYS
jgi:pre-mRNA-processing factor 19